MDLHTYNLEELLLATLKSEVDSKEVYLKLADRIENAFLKDKLKFLAGEEEKHKTFVESLYAKEFPEKEILIPGKTPVPLPRIKIEGPVSEVIGSAMEAETAAYDFYNLLSDRFPDNSAIKKTLVYLARMEMGHYKLLEIEKETIDKYEDYDTLWPMIHLGP